MSTADHLLRAFRETLRGSGKQKRAGELAVLLAAYDKVGRSLEETRRKSRTLRAELGLRAAEGEHLTALARNLLSRTRDVRGSTQAVREALEGVRLMGLNSGLEGARLADAASAPLLRLSDEVRARAVQGLEALDELSSLLGQLDGEREGLRDATRSLGTALANLQQHSEVEEQCLADLDGAVGALGEAIERATGADPDLAPLLAQAAEHARGLASALSGLASRDAARMALRALQPMLDPLLGVIDEIYGQDEGPR